MLDAFPIDASRIATFIKSTAMNTLHALANEMPLVIRRNMLSLNKIRRQDEQSTKFNVAPGTSYHFTYLTLYALSLKYY